MPLQNKQIRSHQLTQLPKPRMRNSILLLLLLFATSVLRHGVAGYDGEGSRGRAGGEESPWGTGGEEEEEPSRYGKETFLLQNAQRVFQTDAGEMTVMRTDADRLLNDRPMHIGFITMEPRTLFIPQYSDSSLLLFLRRGEARVGRIYKDELVERRLKIGDIYRIPAGSAFYIHNTEEGQRLHIICSIDPSESLGIGTFQSFFIAGGSYPTSVLSGFDRETLTTAFNVTTSELGDLFDRQQQGPIIYVNESRAPRVWTSFLRQKEERVEHMRRVVEFQEHPIQEVKETANWSWRKLLDLVMGKEETNKGWKKSPDSYNLYKRSADFRNDYGWSIAVDGSDYTPLKHSGMGVYLVNLTAGSMMAPHVNPRATEYGVVLNGRGRIQVVFPNGTLAMDAKVQEGDVFWVPRYFAFCQIASRSGPFQFFGFTTSAHKNRPQFLVGANSLLHALGEPVLAAAFGVSEERIRDVMEAQREAVIIPSAAAAPGNEAARGSLRR